MGVRCRFSLLYRSLAQSRPGVLLLVDVTCSTNGSALDLFGAAPERKRTILHCAKDVTIVTYDTFMTIDDYDLNLESGIIESNKR